MKSRKFAALFTAVMLLFSVTAYADGSTSVAVPTYTAVYEIEDSYDAATETYTAEVYLTTTKYLYTGSIGIKYDSTLSPTFTLDEENFTYYRNLASDGDNFIAFQWYLNDINIVPTAKLHLGTITIEHVTLGSAGYPVGWHKGMITQLDWLSTDSAQTDFYNTDHEGDGLVLNDEIWHAIGEGETAPEDAYGIALTGYYQGLDLEGGTESDPWVDIGYHFTTIFDELPDKAGQNVSGLVQSYNPNNALTVNLYKKEDNGEYTTTPYDSLKFETPADYTRESIKGYDVGIPYVYNSGDAIIYADGRVICKYAFSGVDAGEYKLELVKDVHLTYTEEITVEEGKDFENAKTIELYCGDISGNGRIKVNDRSALVYSMNKRVSTSENNIAKRCDLSGDGKITVHDLNILNTYFNKSY